MPWVNAVAGIIQAWYSGNEVGNALADLLFGRVNPSGRLPLTLPVRIQDVPSYLNDKCENGKIQSVISYFSSTSYLLSGISYREDLFVGYKHYQARDIRPLFPFGSVTPYLPLCTLTIKFRHGLSYTRFSFSDFKISAPTNFSPTSKVIISALVKNEGDVADSEVLQVYVSYPDVGLTTPFKQLRGFKKVRDVIPGSAEGLEMTLDKYSFSFWDESKNAWKVTAGLYGIHAGFNCDLLPLDGYVEIKDTFYWNGL